jgi:hypothetical protein
MKKILALTVGSLLSFSASASYVRYDFNSGPINGYFIQRDDNQAIADYEFSFIAPGLPTLAGPGFSPITQSGYGEDKITGETTYFRNNGPTNFSVFDNFDYDNVSTASITFSRTTGGDFAYLAQYEHTQKYRDGAGWIWPSVSGTLSGTVSRSTVAASTARDLDDSGGYDYGVTRLVPTYIGPAEVPEPASLALFAVGVISAGVIRRRKATR